MYGSGLSSPPLYPTPNPGQGRYPMPPRPQSGTQSMYGSPVPFPSGSQRGGSPPGYGAQLPSAPGLAVNGRPVSGRNEPRPLPDSRALSPLAGESVPMVDMGDSRTYGDGRPPSGLVVDSRHPTRSGFEPPVRVAAPAVQSPTPTSPSKRVSPPMVDGPRFTLEDVGVLKRDISAPPTPPPKGP